MYKEDYMEKKNFANEEEMKAYLEEQSSKLGEIYSQCWESDDFKKKFMADPKAVLKEYGVNYDENKDYRVIDSPEKSIVQVIPYENTKKAMEAFTQGLMKSVEGLGDEDSKQILLEGWKWEIYQNTEDVNYLVIPHSPENLSPEELEMINGGCAVAMAVFLVGAVLLVIGAVGVGMYVEYVLQVVAAYTIAIYSEKATWSGGGDDGDTE